MMLRVAFIGAGQMARNHLHAIKRTGHPATIVGAAWDLLDGPVHDLPSAPFG